MTQRKKCGSVSNFYCYFLIFLKCGGVTLKFSGVVALIRWSDNFCWESEWLRWHNDLKSGERHDGVNWNKWGMPIAQHWIYSKPLSRDIVCAGSTTASTFARSAAGPLTGTQFWRSTWTLTTKTSPSSAPDVAAGQTGGDLPNWLDRKLAWYIPVPSVVDPYHFDTEPDQQQCAVHTGNVLVIYDRYM